MCGIHKNRLLFWEPCVPIPAAQEEGSALAQKKASLRRIAEETGLSPATLSRALNHCGQVSELSWTCAMEAANGWGYQKSPKEALQVGIILPDRPQFFWKRLADELLRKLREANVRFALALVPQLRDDLQVCRCVQDMTERGAALLILPVAGEMVASCLRALNGSVAVWMLREYRELTNAFAFVPDLYEAGSRMGRLLAQREVHRIVMIRDGTKTGQEWEAGLKQTCPAAASCPVLERPPEHIRWGGAFLARQIQQRNLLDLEALVCCDGTTLSGALALHKLGLYGKAVCIGWQDAMGLTPYLQNKTIAAVAAPCPETLGERAAAAAIQYLQDRTFPGEKMHREAVQILVNS